MRKLIFTGASALALAAIPVATNAQAPDAPPPSADAAIAEAAVYEMDQGQRAAYDGWPPDRRAIYDGWDTAHQAYYWSLTPNQQEGWWLLSDEQRGQIYSLTPAQRDLAWTSVEEQLAAQGNNPASAPAANNRSTSPAGAGVEYESNEVAQNIPNQQPDEYPLCTDGQTDSCINPWAAGERGAGVTRPLDHWPGQPASQGN